MPLDSARHEPPDREAALKRVLADDLFKQIVVELVEAALDEDAVVDITPEAFERIKQQPAFVTRVEAVVAAVIAEQLDGWT